jgi:hypothetical protein
MKPYRLLSNKELNHIQTLFDLRFRDWNQRYAQSPLTFSLQKASKLNPLHNPIGMSTDALVEKDLFSLISISLFGEEHDAFEPVCRQLGTTLFESLLQKENLSLDNTPKPQDWIYKGSTCLFLEIGCENKRISCLLSPEWVQTQLSQTLKSSKAPLATLNDALKEHLLPLDVTLNPIRLHLKQILLLQKGDLIKTDHMLHEPLCLKQGKSTLAHVQLGQNNNQKSIIIRSST